MEGADIRVPCLRSMAEAEGTRCPLRYSGSCLYRHLSVCLHGQEKCLHFLRSKTMRLLFGSTHSQDGGCATPGHMSGGT